MLEYWITEKGIEKNFVLTIERRRTKLINVPLQHREKNKTEDFVFFFEGNEKVQTKLTGHCRIGLIDHFCSSFFFYLKKKRILVSDHNKIERKLK